MLTDHKPKVTVFKKKHLNNHSACTSTNLFMFVKTKTKGENKDCCKF